MKRLFFSFLILTLLFTYNYYSEKYVINYCNEINSILESCAQSIKEEKHSQAKRAVSELLKSWEKNDILLSVFIGDSSVTEPEKCIISIYHNLNDKNYSYCLTAIRECQGYFHEMSENTQTSFGRVL